MRRGEIKFGEKVAGLRNELLISERPRTKEVSVYPTPLTFSDTLKYSGAKANFYLSPEMSIFASS